MEAWGGMGGWLAIGALYRKELRQILRSAGALAIENAWLVIVLAIAALTALVGTAAWSPSWRVGSTAFWVIMSVQAVAVAVVIPTFAASLVTGEHGSNTWDVLRSAPITPRQVIYGKLLAASAVHIAVLSVSAPVAAAAFLLGGVALPSALWALALVLAGSVFATALGLYCSTLVLRTAAAVPIAAGLGLSVLGVFAAAANGSPAIGAASPLQAVAMLAGDRVPALFGVGVPVWAASLVWWLCAGAAAVEASVQRLRHRHHQRQWGVRWRALILLALLALAALGSMQAFAPEAVTGAPAAEPHEIAANLMGYVVVLGHLLVLAVATVAAGLPTTLDERWARGEAADDFSVWERQFGLSLDGGARYALLLTGVGLAVTLVGMALWGGDLLRDWWAPAVLGFLPVFAAVWMASQATRCISYLGVPRSGTGRQIVALVAVIVLAVLTFVPAWVLNARIAEPTFAGELAAIPVLVAAIGSAFDLPAFAFETTGMQRLIETIPLALLTTALYVCFGFAFAALRRAARGRWARRLMARSVAQAAEGEPATQPEPHQPAGEKG